MYQFDFSWRTTSYGAPTAIVTCGAERNLAKTQKAGLESILHPSNPVIRDIVCFEWKTNSQFQGRAAPEVAKAISGAVVDRRVQAVSAPTPVVA
jgi:hypothetical protein